MRDDSERYKKHEPIDPIHHIGKSPEQKREEWRQKHPLKKFWIEFCLWIIALACLLFGGADFPSTERAGVLLNLFVWFGWTFPAYRLWQHYDKSTRN